MDNLLTVPFPEPPTALSRGSLAHAHGANPSCEREGSASPPTPRMAILGTGRDLRSRRGPKGRPREAPDGPLNGPCLWARVSVFVRVFVCVHVCVCRLRLTPLPSPLPPVAPLTHSPRKATAPSNAPAPRPPVLRPQLGKDRFVFSMDGNGKIIIAQNSEIQQMNVKTAMEEIVDGAHRRAPEKTGGEGGRGIVRPSFSRTISACFSVSADRKPPSPGGRGGGWDGWATGPRETMGRQVGQSTGGDTFPLDTGGELGRLRRGETSCTAPSSLCTVAAL